MPASRVYLISLIVVPSVVVFLAWVFSYNESIIWNTLPEFIAGFMSGVLGIILGFEIDRIHQSNQQEKRIDFALRSMKDEMQLNYGHLGVLQDRIKKGEECFTLLRTRTWDMFGNQLDSFKDFQFVLSLGYYYWELNHLNEAMKKNSMAHDLENFYAYYPPFNGINDLLEHLKGSSISFQQHIDKYFFER